MQRISKFILFNILGWKVPNDFPTDIKKYIIIAAPHTSNWDFPIAVLSKFAKGMDINFIGKCLNVGLTLLRFSGCAVDAIRQLFLVASDLRFNARC